MEVNSSIWSIVRGLHRVAQLQRRAAARSSLGPIALGVLNLAAQAPVRPSEAAAELNVPAQSITRAVADLTGAGLVGRIGDEGDGRSYAIELTGEGRTAHAAFREQLTEQFSRHLAGWSEEEIAIFAGQLGRLVSALAAEVPPAPQREPGRNPWREGT
jgi:DNA-binding MarR family transcriptional regulator